MRKNRRSQLALAIAALLVVVALLIYRPWDRGADSSSDSATQTVDSKTSDRKVRATPTESTPTPKPTTDSRSLQLTAATVERDGEFPTGLFSGRVVNWGNGRGVAGAELVFAGPAGAESIASDADGMFRFVPSEVGEHRLVSITADSYIPYAPDLGASRVSLSARGGAHVRGLRFTLTPAINYRGIVVDESNNPVPGAAVSLRTTGVGEVALLPIKNKFVADEKGEFTFSAPDGSILEASDPERGVGRARLDSAAQTSHQLTITLRDDRPKLATIAGLITDKQGLPISGVSLLPKGFVRRMPKQPTDSTNGWPGPVSMGGSPSMSIPDAATS